MSNNNFTVNQDISGFVAMWVDQPGMITSSDYNNLHAFGSPIFTYYNGSFYGTLAAWQGATGWDANSISADPEYVSDTNLHLQLYSPSIGAGTASAIVNDIDGDIRPNPALTNPDIGADETPLSEPACQPLAGVYTIGGVSPDFPTIDSSVQALIECGIDSVVIFNIRAGTYIEQSSIPDITGTSYLNTITYRAENGDSSSVKLAVWFRDRFE